VPDRSGWWGWSGRGTAHARFLRSAFKHGLTESDIQWVLDNPNYFGPMTSRYGNPGQLFVGVTQWGIAEVFTETDPSTGEVVVYHARPVSVRVARRYMGR